MQIGWRYQLNDKIRISQSLLNIINQLFALWNPHSFDRRAENLVLIESGRA
jgi:hypothetical protein